MTSLLEVRNLKKLYPVSRSTPEWVTRLRAWANHDTAFVSRLHAVDDVSFRIEAGESVGLVGESGCGKSTLVSLLNRLIEPTAGQIRFDGEVISRIPPRQFVKSPYRAAIQVVFQDPHDSLNPRFTAFDAIAEPLRRMHIVEKKKLPERVRELADQVGLADELLGRFPHQLSGGQKARVNIARALATEPRLLVLDEPTSALDVSVQAMILQLLADLRARHGISYLFISHDLNVVRLLCDRIIVMYLGRIVETGPTQDVFEAPAHPYTRALVGSIPSPFGTDEAHARAAGEPRSPVDPDPDVCRYYGRCPLGQTLCTQEQPSLHAVGEGRQAACHFAEPGPRAGRDTPAMAAGDTEPGLHQGGVTEAATAGDDGGDH